MAQKQTGLIIWLSVFAVLFIMASVFWYMSYTDGQKLQTDLATAQKGKQDDTRAIQDQVEQLKALKTKMGFGQDVPTGHNDSGDQQTVLAQADQDITRLAGNGTGAPPNYRGALIQESAENDNNSFNATERQRLLDEKQRELVATIAQKDEEIRKHREARETAEQELVKQEAAHSEEMQRLEQQNDQLRQEKTQNEQEFAAYRVTAERQIQDLNEDINGYRDAVVTLRQRLREKEDLAFFRPDGTINTVDHLARRVYIDLGAADGLRVGVSFSVYEQGHSGVGKANTTDIKGKIEVTRLLGPHRAEAAIVKEEQGATISEDDPIFSPLFQSGQALEVVVLGGLTVDGLSREQFRSQVRASGSRIAVEVNDKGEFVDGRGNVITAEEAQNLITPRVRFVVVGDLGDLNTKDQKLQVLYEKIQQNAQLLRKEAEKKGIYEVGLSTFLEHIGYNRKQVSWTPENEEPFPGVLVNGARSAKVNGSMGNRASSASISGVYSGRRRTPSVSTGTTSKYYKQ